MMLLRYDIDTELEVQVPAATRWVRVSPAALSVPLTVTLPLAEAVPVPLAVAAEPEVAEAVPGNLSRTAGVFTSKLPVSV